MYYYPTSCKLFTNELIMNFVKLHSIAQEYILVILLPVIMRQRFFIKKI